MLSMRDCLDYCDLTDEEIALLAEHEQIPDAAAAAVACAMVQTPEGVVVLTHYLMDVIEHADACGDHRKACIARSVCARFIADHPLPH